MIIKCPECNQQVSDKASVCIHCGFPLNEYNKESAKLYKIMYDESRNGAPGILVAALRKVLKVSTKDDWQLAANIIKKHQPIITGLSEKEADNLRKLFEKRAS